MKNQRLDRARQMLFAALPAATVADVASATGYRSAGRFSVDYRKHFHESPSETLSRSRATWRRRGGGAR